MIDDKHICEFYFNTFYKYYKTDINSMHEETGNKIERMYKKYGQMRKTRRLDYNDYKVTRIKGRKY